MKTASRILSVKKVLGVLGAFLVVGSFASATPMLKISDGTSTIVITDGDIGSDANSAAGAVTFMGSIGTWTLNVTTGLSSSPISILDLNSIDGSSAAGGTLTISLTDTGFSSFGTPTSSIGGTTVGIVNYQTFWDQNNVAFAATNLLSSASYNTRSFNGTFSTGTSISDNAYSLTQVVTITHTKAGISSFDGMITVVPDGGTTFLLLGIGLAAVGFSTRRLAPIPRQ